MLNKLPEYSTEFLMLHEIAIAKTLGSSKEIVKTKSISFNNSLIGKNSILKEIDSVLRIPFFSAFNEIKKMVSTEQNQETVSNNEQEEKTFKQYDVFGSMIYPFMKWEQYCNLIKFLIDKKAILFDNVSCETQSLVGDDDSCISIDDMHCIVGYITENFILKRMNT